MSTPPMSDLCEIVRRGDLEDDRFSESLGGVYRFSGGVDEPLLDDGDAHRCDDPLRRLLAASTRARSMNHVGQRKRLFLRAGV